MEAAGGSAVRIDRKSSIENEPRTLTIDQIQFARDAALYVVKTRSFEEAMSIFMEGLEPVANVGSGYGDSMSSSEIEYCLGDQLPLPGIREVVSAPF